MTHIQWMKIVEALYDSRKIKVMMPLPKGNPLINHWLKQLCLAQTAWDIPFARETRTDDLRHLLSAVLQAPEPLGQLGLTDSTDGLIRISITGQGRRDVTVTSHDSVTVTLQ